jgi:hypothetical protein
MAKHFNDGKLHFITLDSLHENFQCDVESMCINEEDKAICFKMILNGVEFFVTGEFNELVQ